MDKPERPVSPFEKRTPAGSDTSEFDLARVLPKLLLIPDRARRFSISTREANRRFGMPLALLEALVTDGGPSRRRRDEVYFDRHDLFNVSLHLGVGSMARVAQRTWAAAFRNALLATSGHDLEYQATCPIPGHGQACSWTLALPGHASDDVRLHTDEGSLKYGVKVPACGELPPAPELIADLLEEVGSLELMRIPPSLQGDAAFITMTGMTDCLGAAALLADRARERGLRSRQSFGLMLAPPFANVHHWAEIEVDGVWVPFDPVMVNAMLRWRLVDPEYWHVGRSVGPLVARVADAYVPLVRHEGAEVPASLPMSRTAGH
ncbi:transglutaminase domain-containing protein [Streptacidiphilus sp. P02-A3a]|uniref:transglutaminase domain-containing protein n=1 Tax=Streptacidiphilus sp. P02-A3a TaxID=2704468 RepID=UPI0015F8D956|nr:transglutaminase domain-containing protein [Streptacidiphilus sp. P02-A3a]QMU67203.1 hypothetical protein GXP74_02240 [Streptacidiphilus sp. P02-A3a]